MKSFMNAEPRLLISCTMIDDDNIRLHFCDTNDIRLHVAEAGPVDGPLVFLLHGFPEFWYSWRHQIGPLAAAGLRVVAVDQRGYNLSDKPKGKRAYDLDVVCNDILGMADALGEAHFSVVGHDWGGIVAWRLAELHPQRVRRLAVLNAAHPSLWREAILHDPVQRKKSWYVAALQIPLLPEWLIKVGRYRGLVDALRSSSRADAFSDADVQRYEEAWRQPGALTAMINWYRAAAGKTLPPAASIRIEAPTHILWGVNDHYAVRELAEQSRQLCQSATVEYFEHATHWLQHDEPKAVADRLIAFLQESVAA